MKTSITVALVGAAIALNCLSPASAAAPMAKTQAPGFYRMILGHFEITALNDGVVDHDTGQVLPRHDARAHRQKALRYGPERPYWYVVQRLSYQHWREAGPNRYW
jgi:hypothetical protein